MPRASQTEPLDPDERLLLRIFRYIGAAYTTGDAACWDAAHDAAEAAEGVFDGPLLVGRATALIRLLRRGVRDIDIMPPSSRWLSPDEDSLMTLVRSARGSEAVGWARRLDGSVAGAERLIIAAEALPKSRNPAARSGVAPLAFATPAGSA